LKKEIINRGSVPQFPQGTKMATKSISKQIFDDFIEELFKNESIENHRVESLKNLLNSGSVNKDDLIKLLKEEEKHENP